MSIVCRHCNRSNVNRPRGLCWTCWHDGNVRAQYPITHPFARRGVPDRNGRVPLAQEPTAAPPGSPDKVAVMEDRAAQGLALWHPHDAGGTRLGSRWQRLLS